MLERLDLSELSWSVSGWTPYSWQLYPGATESGGDARAEIAPVPMQVPGSVQRALRDGGMLPDWNVGAAARACEWVENRHWMCSTRIPSGRIPRGGRIRLRCDGLDYSGWVLVNGVEVGAFVGSQAPHLFDITEQAAEGDLALAIVFDTPPRWLGQFGYTSRYSEWKPRFNYTWDWVARLVQVGIWDDIRLEFVEGDELGAIAVRTDVDLDSSLGSLTIRARPTVKDAASAIVTLTGPDGGILRETVNVDSLTHENSFRDLPVQLWRPNGAGGRCLYDVTVELVDAAGRVLDRAVRRVGFRKVEWRANPGAPEGADPWLCVVNGEPIFLQGVNWTPIRPNFADVAPEDYRQRLELYRDLGANLLRVWGGGFLEKAVFYALCDELGLMVWQDFPLSSSGVENWPPEEQSAIDSMEVIVRSYIERRAHHACLILWCGGNELQGDLDGSKTGGGKPVTLYHPMMARMDAVVRELDPARRFVPTSSSGPLFYAHRAEMGKGLHWDVHGPWNLGDMSMDEWREYWGADDALFRSECGAPGASGADLIRACLGEYPETPGTLENELWRRTSWWIEWPHFIKEIGREPKDLDEYVAWSQARQAAALSVIVRTEKSRFPGIGGVLLWMGHDSFPCAANTAIIDYWGRPKPAALVVGEIWRAPAG